MFRVSCQFCGMTLNVERAIAIEGIGYACCNRHATMIEQSPKGVQYEKTRKGNQGFSQVALVSRDSFREDLP